MTETDDVIRRKRLRFRSWHRGVKETDLVLGTFADKLLQTLDSSLLDRYEALLEESDADIWNWLCGRENAPEPYSELITLLLDYKS